MKVPQSLLDYQKTCLIALQRCRSDVESLTARLQAAQVGEQVAQASLDATALAIETIEEEPDISASSEPPPPPTEPLDRVELLPGWPPEPPSPEVESPVGDDPDLPADWNKVQENSPLSEVSKAPFRPGCTLELEAPCLNRGGQAHRLHQIIDPW